MWSTLDQRDESSQQDNLLPPKPPATSQPYIIHSSSDVSTPDALSDSLNISASSDDTLHKPLIPEQTVALDHDERFDTTGQVAPPGIKPKLIKIEWASESTMCSVVEARDILVPRREDNHMINGTKLLNVAGMARGNQVGILKSEKLKHGVEIGPEIFEGLWVPFERALKFANKEGITPLLYPLFVQDKPSQSDLDPSQYSKDMHPDNYNNSTAEASGSSIPYSSTHKTTSLGTPSLCTLSMVDDISGPEASISNPTPSIRSTGEYADEVEEFPMMKGKIPLEPRFSGIACQRCRKHKIRCSVAAPCDGCIKAGQECVCRLPEAKPVSFKQLEPSSNTKQELEGSTEWSRLERRSDKLSEINQEKSSTSGLYRGGQWHCNCEPRLPAVMLIVRRDSRNNGRSFYTCQKRGNKDKSCGFFLWADDAKVHEKIDNTSYEASTKMTTGGSILSQSTALTSDSVRNEFANVFAGFVAGPLSPKSSKNLSQNTQKSDTEILTQGLETHNTECNAPNMSSDQPSLGDCGKTTSGKITDIKDDSYRSSLSPSLIPPHSDSESSSSDEEQDLVLREGQRAALLDRLMDYFLSILASCPSPVPSTRGMYREHTGSESSSIGTSFDMNRASTGDGRRSDANANANANSHRKRLRDDEEEDHEENGDSKRARVQESPAYSSKRLACPYFKKDPGHYHTWRSCSGPGWETVHRVKEHLYRNHSMPISCPRCHEPFSTEVDRDSHVRSMERCEIRELTDGAGGFNTTQRDLLKSRKRGYKQMSEPQKWREVYLILFPDTQLTDIPSPYYEFKTTADPGNPVDPLSEYERFLRRELPDRVRQQLEVRIESALHPVEEALRSQIVDIVRDTQLDLFQSYISSFSQPPGDVEHQVQPVEQLEQHLTVVQNQIIANASTQPLSSMDYLENQLQAYRPEPFLEAGFSDFNGLLFDFGEFQGQQAYTESAYESMPTDFMGDGKFSSILE